MRLQENKFADVFDGDQHNNGDHLKRWTAFTRDEHGLPGDEIDIAAADRSEAVRVARFAIEHGYAGIELEDVEEWDKIPGRIFTHHI